MARRSSSSWSGAAAGCALAVGLVVALCSAAPVGATDVVPEPLPAGVAGERPLGSARDLQRPSPALAPVASPDVVGPVDVPYTAVTAVPANADRLQKVLKTVGVPASSSVDPVRLQKRLPNGLPLTYRVCSQAPDRNATCTERVPSGVPVLVDVAGGDAADLLLDAVPAAGTDALVAAAGLRDEQRRADALAGTLAGGLTMLSLRLPTSDVAAASPLRASVRIDYELPSGQQLSIGLDGSDGLPRATSATFGSDPSAGITASLRNIGATAPFAVSVTSAAGDTFSARATAPVPASMRLSARTGNVTGVEVDNSATTDRIDLALAGRGGAVRAALTKVPKRADYVLDVPDRSATASASGTLGRIEFLARVPVGGRTWSSSADVSGLRARLDAEFGEGELSVRSSRGAIGSVALAVANHDTATVPQSADYLAVHHDDTSGDLDAGVSVPDAREVDYARTAAGDQTYQLDTGPSVVALDTDIRADGDVQYFVGGLLTAPARVGIATSGGQLRYTSDVPLGVRLTVAAGKVGALNDLFVPLYDSGVAVRVAGCHGDGCETDGGAFCSASGRCFAVGANLAVDSDAPTLVATDLRTGVTQLAGRRSGEPIDVYFARDGSGSQGGS